MIPDWHLPVAAVLNHFELAGCTQNHCQIGNMGVALKVILSWLDETGGRTP